MRDDIRNWRSAALVSVTIGLFVICIVLAAFAQSEDSVSKWDYAELTKAPEEARSRHNPLQDDPDVTAAGKKVFRQHCSECHGDDAGGAKRGPSLRAAEVQQATPGALFWLLTNGVVRRGMPVWSKLPEPQRWQIVAYVKSLGHAPLTPHRN